jgi:hypothetical protein
MESHGWRWRRAGWAALLCVVVLPAGQTLSRSSEEKASDEKARAHLKAMTTFLSGLTAFSITVDEAFDTVDDEGLKLQANRRRRVCVNRPDQLRSDTSGDTADLLFVCRRGGFLLLDKEHNSYVAEKGPDTIDAMLEELAKKYGRSAPLSDFLKAHPYGGLMEAVREGRYVGLSQIGDRKCHHLAFRQKLLDWQVWVEDGERPLPRKFVITYKRMAGEPQYTAVLHHWELEPKLDPQLFDLTPPAGAKKVEIAVEGPAKKP